MKPTLNDIAKRTGLSVATVSRALHRADSPNVSGETRERVRSIARELGYQPNLLSRSLAKGRTHTISYWTYNAFTPYYAAVASEICQQASRREYFVHVHNTFDPVRHLDASGVDRDPGLALALSFDGIIACDVAYAANHYAAQLQQSGIPMVGIGINHPTNCDYVDIDLAYGARQAMEHLLSIGCRRIAHLGHGDAIERADARALVYQEMMDAAGLPTEWIGLKDHVREQARIAIIAHVQEKGVPEAILCVNDAVAVGCYRGLADIGVEVPDDVRLVGCDGLVETAYHRCPITTIATPIAQMCALAWDFLEARMTEPDRPLQQVVVRPELVIRESTAGQRPARKEVAEDPAQAGE